MRYPIRRYQKNPSITCPGCGTGNKAGRDTCWKCNWELTPAEKPIFGRALRPTTGFRHNPSITCPGCGTGNKAGRTICWKCNWELTPTEKPIFGRALRPTTSFRRNPLCLTHSDFKLGDSVIGFLQGRYWYKCGKCGTRYNLASNKQRIRRRPWSHRGAKLLRGGIDIPTVYSPREDEGRSDVLRRIGARRNPALTWQAGITANCRCDNEFCQCDCRGNRDLCNCAYLISLCDCGDASCDCDCDGDMDRCVCNLRSNPRWSKRRKGSRKKPKACKQCGGHDLDIKGRPIMLQPYRKGLCSNCYQAQTDVNVIVVRPPEDVDPKLMQDIYEHREREEAREFGPPRKISAARISPQEFQKIKREAKTITDNIPSTQHFMEGGSGVAAYIWAQIGNKKEIVGSTSSARLEDINSAISKLMEIPGVKIAWYNLD